MPFEFKIIRQVEFSDTDAAGIAHFTAYFRYMEAAELAFCRSLGFSVLGRAPGNPRNPRSGSQVYGLPRVHARCDYSAPLRFEEQVQVQLLVRAKGSRSLGYTFIFRRVADGKVGEEVARGEMTVVYITLDPATGAMKSAPIPAPIAKQIEVAPVEMLG